MDQSARGVGGNSEAAKLDTEANPNVSTANGIRSIPTLILYRAGREIARQSGAMASADLVRWVHGQLAREAGAP